MHRGVIVAIYRSKGVTASGGPLDDATTAVRYVADVYERLDPAEGVLAVVRNGGGAAARVICATLSDLLKINTQLDEYRYVYYR